MKIDIDPDGLHISTTITPAQMKWGMRGLTLAAVLGAGLIGNNALEEANNIDASRELLENVTEEEKRVVSRAFCAVATQVDIPADHQLLFLIRPKDGDLQSGLYFNPNPQYCLEGPP